MRTARITLVCLVAAFASGCSAGGYFGDRGSDLADCFRFEMGAFGIGGGVKALGVAHAGIGGDAGMLVVGWDYGQAVSYDVARSGRGGMGGGGRLNGYFGVHVEHGRRTNHLCFGLVPGLLSRVGDSRDSASWLWTAPLSADVRWARVHAFDVEVTLCLGIGITLGFSPGEFLDFLLGWIGIDLAADDRAAPRR